MLEENITSKKTAHRALLVSLCWTATNECGLVALGPRAPAGQALEPASGLVAAPYDPAWDGLPERTEPARAC